MESLIYVHSVYPRFQEQGEVELPGNVYRQRTRASRLNLGPHGPISITMITADLLAPRASREIQLGAARILLVDDDALVRQCMRMMLARAGYHVTTAANVSEAINQLA